MDDAGVTWAKAEAVPGRPLHAQSSVGAASIMVRDATCFSRLLGEG